MKFTEEQMKSFDMQKWYDLSGQVAIVTGGASGLGLAITHCLISAGATVCVVGTRGYDEVKADLEPFGNKADYYVFNVTDTDNARY